MTEYRLAMGGDDYRRAHELMTAEHMEQDELAFPTMMAWKDNELTGFISTHISNDLIVAGPMVIKSGRPRYWTLIRLIENYETVMRDIGITAYVFSIDASDEKWTQDIWDIYGTRPYAERDGRKFFVRNI